MAENSDTPRKVGFPVIVSPSVPEGTVVVYDELADFDTEDFDKVLRVVRGVLS